MARRTADEAAEPTQADSTSEAAEASAADAATPTTEVAVDLTAFGNAADAAVAERDSATGVLPEAAYTAVVTEYRALPDVKARNKAKGLLVQRMKDAMEKLDAPLAKAYMLLQDKGTSAAPSAKVEKAPADPTAAYIEKAVALRLALNLVPQPEGLASDWADQAKTLSESAAAQVESYRAFLDSTDENKVEPEGILPVVKSAFKLAAGKAAGASRATGTHRTGPTRNIGTHIKEVFADQPVGTFMKISQIRAAKSAEYGDDQPSAGAISAHLFPASGKARDLDGIVAKVGPEGDKGAEKVS